MIWAKGSFSGKYEPLGTVADADSIALIEFAVPRPEQGPGLVHKAEVVILGEYLRKYACLSEKQLPVFTNRFSAAEIERTHELNDLNDVRNFEVSQSSTFTAENTGTWGELQQIKQAGLEKPLLIGQAYHIGRVAMQAKKCGLTPIVLPGLPKMFDPNSAQSFTRGWPLWAIREFIGAPVLRYKGHL